MTISVVINSLPANGGSSITDIEYRINGGTGISLGVAVPGTYATIANLGDNVDLAFRNSVGLGPWSSPSKNIPALGFFPALATQAFSDNSGNQTYVFPAATGAGLTFNYALTSPPSGVTINGATRTITFDTNAMAPQSGTVITVTATDNLGRAATGSPRTFSLTIGVGAVNPTLEPITFADPGNATEDTLTAPVFYPGTDTLRAFVAIRNGGTALTAAQLAAGTGTFLERVVINPFSVSTFNLSGFTATSNAGTAIDMAVAEVNNGGISAAQTVAVSGLDFTAPTFSSGSPADNATGVAVGSNIVLTFSENVFPGTGLFRLRDTTANTQLETFNPATGTGSSGGTISISGAAVTINPFADFPNNNGISVRWDADALRDGDGNPLAANTGDTVYNFTAATAANFTDNFNRANGALGANWTNFTTYGGPGLAYQIVSNRAQTVDPGFNGIRTTTSITGGAFAQATFQGSSGGNEIQYGVILADPTTTTRCYLFIQNRAGGSLELYRVTASGSSFALLAAGTAGNLVAGDVMRIERTIVNASTVRVRALVNGTQVATFDDTDANRISGDVFGGLWGEINTAGRLADMDDFSQGTI